MKKEEMENLRNMMDLAKEAGYEAPDPSDNFLAKILQNFYPNFVEAPTEEATKPFEINGRWLGFNAQMPLESWLGFVQCLTKVSLGSFADFLEMMSNLAYSNLMLYENKDDIMPTPISRAKLEEIIYNKYELLTIPKRFADYMIFFILKSLK